MLKTPFIMFADCQVDYEGRAASSSTSGHYLIIAKADGSIMVHAAELLKPLNYQGRGTVVTYDGTKLIAKSKHEMLAINIRQAHFSIELPEWSCGSITLSRTEKDLVDKFVASIPERFPNAIFVERERSTPYGKIDLFIECPEDVYVIEAKRGKANVGASSQLKRYADHVRLQHGWKNVKEILVCPAISKGCQKHLDASGQHWVELDFD